MPKRMAEGRVTLLMPLFSNAVAVAGGFIFPKRKPGSMPEIGSVVIAGKKWKAAVVRMISGVLF